MRALGLIAASLVLALASLACAAAQPSQVDKAELTVVKYDDHVQIECNPVSIDTAMRGDWETICNALAATQVQKLAAAGTIAPVKGPVFDLTAHSSGAALSRSIALLNHH